MRHRGLRRRRMRRLVPGVRLASPAAVGSAPLVTRASAHHLDELFGGAVGLGKAFGGAGFPGFLHHVASGKCSRRR